MSLILTPPLSITFDDLREEVEAVKEVRNNTMNKKLAKTVARRATTLVLVVSRLKVNCYRTAPSTMYVITRGIISHMLTF